MEKKEYLELEMEVVRFSTEDVIDGSPVNNIPVDTNQGEWKEG